ncbi:MAG: GNAT family protein [Chloroflexota bacterium]
MPYFKKLAGQKCYLSPCQATDAEKWVEWFNNPEISLPLGDEVYLPYSLEKAREDLAGIIRDQSYIFTIVALENDFPIGRGLLFAIDPIDRRAMLGMAIGEKSYWGQGYGTEATRLLVDYGFNLLNLNSIMLGVFAFNARAIACYKKVGFKEIGRRRQARIIAGQKYDVLLMDILAEEFQGSCVGGMLAAATSADQGK